MAQPRNYTPEYLTNLSDKGVTLQLAARTEDWDRARNRLGADHPRVRGLFDQYEMIHTEAEMRGLI